MLDPRAITALATHPNHRPRGRSIRTIVILIFVLVVFQGVVVVVAVAAARKLEDVNDDSIVALDDIPPPPRHSDSSLQHQRQRLHDIKMELWSQGEFMLDQRYLFGDDETAQVLGMEELLQHRRRQGQQQRPPHPQWYRKDPLRQARWTEWNRQQEQEQQSISPYNYWGATIPWQTLRGGGSSPLYNMNMEIKLEELSAQFGPDFMAAIEQNKRDHVADCQLSCELYYCAPSLNTLTGSTNDILQEMAAHNTTFRSYSFGAVPPEDFADAFGFPLDLIHVTQGAPIVSKKEARDIIQLAQTEGVDHNEYQSGKCKLGGNWLTELPLTRAWFNQKLETTLFPLLARLFPQIVSSPSVLRAHSVSLLKYNASHPRTDIHVDNGILALTIAMTPQEEYQGGGTFVEHFDRILEMDVGHITLRPGSVRHGGHRVTAGQRYVLGAFLLIEDRVEHVRRLKNRGSELRRLEGRLDDAARYFGWALALNPSCTTCLKDWAEILHAQGNFAAAEIKIRQALELLEFKDSDALFTLGLLLSEQGRDKECIQAYQQSLALNGEDAELLYNLGVKIGERQRSGQLQSINEDPNEEMQLYARCTQVDPNFGGAWLNWGTALAERGDMDSAQVMFLKAAACHGSEEVPPKALVNLALIYHQRAGEAFQRQDIGAAKAASLQAAVHLDSAKPLLEGSLAALSPYLSQHKTIRLACHRNLGQIFAGSGNLAASESEFRQATAAFPEEITAWQMLGRVLEIQGKMEEMQKVLAKVRELQQLQ